MDSEQIIGKDAVGDGQYSGLGDRYSSHRLG